MTTDEQSFDVGAARHPLTGELLERGSGLSADEQAIVHWSLIEFELAGANANNLPTSASRGYSTSQTTLDSVENDPLQTFHVGGMMDLGGDAGRARCQGADDNELKDAMASLEESIRSAVPKIRYEKISPSRFEVQRVVAVDE
jgi:hypothetical protein